MLRVERGGKIGPLFNKKGGSSTIVPLNKQTSLTGNTPLSISTIQDKLGIVKFNQLGAAVKNQMAEIRKQYEGTDQWMKAPNGKDTNLSEEQWLAVRTPAFKELFLTIEDLIYRNFFIVSIQKKLMIVSLNILSASRSSPPATANPI